MIRIFPGCASTLQWTHFAQLILGIWSGVSKSTLKIYGESIYFSRRGCWSLQGITKGRVKCSCSPVALVRRGCLAEGPTVWSWEGGGRRCLKVSVEPVPNEPSKHGISLQGARGWIQVWVSESVPRDRRTENPSGDTEEGRAGELQLRGPVALPLGLKSYTKLGPVNCTFFF